MKRPSPSVVAMTCRPRPSAWLWSSLKIVSLPALLIAAFSGLLLHGFNGRNPTGYEIELRRIEQEISQLRTSASTFPIDAQSSIRLVYCLYRRATLTGDLVGLREVETAIGKAVQLIGPQDDLCLLKANLDLKFHRLDQAKKDLKMAPGLADSFEGQRIQAELDAQEGRYEKAKKGYQRLIQGKRTWDSLARLAYLHFTTGDLTAAEQLYIEAEDEITAKEMRSYAWVELQRGLLKLSCGRYEEARAHYQRADAAYSGYWLVDEHMAELLGAQGSFDEAGACYERAIARVSRPEIWQALGDLYAFRGKPHLAKPWHDRAVASYLESVQQGEVHYFHHLASFYADVGNDGVEAVKWARKDFQLRQNASAVDALAWALFRAGRVAEALPTIDKALSSGAKSAHMFFHAAMIHAAAGQVGEGEQFLKRVFEINPRYADFHVHR
jgi:tetratricopeptide (TPR) repeat protein